MKINIFSKRLKTLRGEVPDVYAYDSISTPLRVQIVHILHEALGNSDNYRDEYLGAHRAYQFVVDALCREYGQFELVELNRHRTRNYLEELTNFILKEENHERVLDAVEMSFRLVDTVTRKHEYLHRQNASGCADAAIQELNERFQERGIGYRYEVGNMVRIDSELIHSEVIKPALQLLRAKEYQGAQAEFLKAHEHHRLGKTKDALTECLKALESVMKSVCAKRRWPHAPNANCKTLIDLLFEKELLPAFWAGHFAGLRANLENGVPTARNRLGGHGQGSEIVEVPQHIAAYVLHQTAAAIVFIVEAEKASR